MSESAQSDAETDEPAGPDGPDVLRRIAESNALMGALAVFSAAVVGSVLILVADSEVRTTAGYLLARPSDFLHAVASALTGAYSALMRGGVFDWQATTTARMWRPATETLTVSAPLILAGLGMAVAFRAGLFNVGGQGQIILGAMAGGYVGFAWNLPAGLHVLAAMAGAAAGGGAPVTGRIGTSAPVRVPTTASSACPGSDPRGWRTSGTDVPGDSRSGGLARRVVPSAPRTIGAT